MMLCVSHDALPMEKQVAFFKKESRRQGKEHRQTEKNIILQNNKLKKSPLYKNLANPVLHFTNICQLNNKNKIDLSFHKGGV